MRGALNGTAIFILSGTMPAFGDGNLLFRGGETWIGSFDRNDRPLVFQTCDDDQILLQDGDKILVGDGFECPPEAKAEEGVQYTFSFDATAGSFAVNADAKGDDKETECPTPVVGPGPTNPNQLEEFMRLAKAAGLDLSQDFSLPLYDASRLFGAGLIGATEVNGVTYFRKPLEDGATTWDRVTFPDGGGCKSKADDGVVSTGLDWGLTVDNIGIFADIARAKRDFGVAVIPDASWDLYQRSFNEYSPEDFGIIPMLNGMDGLSLDDY